jgi:hypothetical protein
VASGTWSYSLLDLARGDGVAATLRLYGFDAAGNSSAPLTRSFTLDTVPPRITVEPPANPLAELRGTVTDGGGVAELYVRIDQPGVASRWERLSLSGNSWSYRPSLSAAVAYTLTVEARDRAGNRSASAAYTNGATRVNVYVPMIANRRQ